MSENWQDDAWSAVQGHLAGGDAPDESDTISADDLQETGYHGVYSDDDNNWYSIEERGEDQYATPVNATQVELENNLMSMYLEQAGVTYDTADPDQILEAAQKSDNWLASAEQIQGAQVAREVEHLSLTQEVATANLLDAFTDTFADGNAELARPYIERAFVLTENGVAFDEAMQQVAGELAKTSVETNKARRELHYESQGYGGLKTALSNFMAEQNGPQHRGVGHAQKPAPPKTDSPFGSPATATNDMNNAISRFAAEQREAAAFKQQVRENVRAPS